MASVDQLRAYAVLLVIFFHGTQIFGTWIAHDRPFEFGKDWLYSANPAATVIFEGHTGVTLFMVLSGFIFAVGTIGKDVSYPRFMANRLLRIYPLFMVIVLVALAANPGAFGFLPFLQTVLGLGNLPGALVLGDISSGALWAVAVEMQFYLLFPLLNKLLTRFGMPTFLRLFAAIAVIRALVWFVTAAPNPDAILYYNLVGRIDQFLIGMIAAWLYLRYADHFRGWWKIGAGAVVVVAALWAFNQVHGFFNHGWWRLIWVDVEGGMWALVVLTYVATVRATNVVARTVTKIGELSFSLYLLHLVIAGVLVSNRWWIDIPGIGAMASALVTVAVLFLPISIAVALVTYHGIESPFLRLRVKYLIEPKVPVELQQLDRDLERAAQSS